MIDAEHFPVIWGGLGALLYAAPKFLICVRDHPARLAACAGEFAVAMLVGTVASAALAPSISDRWGRAYEHDFQMISTLVGLLANPLSPRIVKATGDFVERWIKARSAE